MKKIILGMSGGVDSSAAALILLNQGYDVEGVTLRLRDGEQVQKDIDDAKAVADVLGIRHSVVDLRDEFALHVISDFKNEYINGRTPNPCIVCNSTIKFGLMLDYALEHGSDYIATGHYAVLEKDKSGLTLLKRSPTSKDQSYFLYRLNQFQLSHSVFPLEGAGSKDEIRALCESAGLPVAHRGDSQEICFIPDDDYVGFLLSEGVESRQGNFIDTAGNVIGKHQGIIRYTIGQRKGLGAFGKPMFVTGIDAVSNTVTLGENGEQYSRGLVADNISIPAMQNLSGTFKAEVKIRFRAAPAPATVTVSGGRMTVVFDTPQRSVTPGQGAVVYIGDTVICGGRIIEILQ